MIEIMKNKMAFSTNRKTVKLESPTAITYAIECTTGVRAARYTWNIHSKRVYNVNGKIPQQYQRYCAAKKIKFRFVQACV